jgi:hypothetical protein
VILPFNNPFVDRSNPELIVTRNPALRPMVNHILELGFSNSPAVPINASINYAFANNAIRQVTSLINDSVSEFTYSNLGTNRSVGINLNKSRNCKYFPRKSNYYVNFPPFCKTKSA